MSSWRDYVLPNRTTPFLAFTGSRAIPILGSGSGYRQTASAQLRAPRTFVRLVPQRDGNLLLQTAVTTFEFHKDSFPRTVRLFSLLHIADPSYYHQIQSSVERSTVLFELITSRTASTGSRKLKRLISQVDPSPSMKTSARSLEAVDQVSALNLMETNWYLADLPRERIHNSIQSVKGLSFPMKTLNLIAACLPCPELSACLLHAYFTTNSFTPERLLQLLNVDLVTKRRLTYAWQAVSSTKVKANSRVLADLDRNRIAWDAIREVRETEVALLYGAWHTGWFCRRAEADGMRFVSQEWITAMTVPNVPVSFIDTLPWTFILVLYCTYAGLDWVLFIEHVARLLAGTYESTVQEFFLYALRHIAPYLAFRRWFDEWDICSALDDE